MNIRQSAMLLQAIHSASEKIKKSSKGSRHELYTSL